MHHTDMNVRLKLDHFLLALGENIGTIGNADEIIRTLKNKWVEYENIEDQLKIRLDEQYPEGAEILRAIDKAQDRIIKHILEITAIILTENQKANRYLSRYDPLARVDRMRMLSEIKTRNQKQTYMFKEEKDAKRFVRVSTGRPFESYHRIGKRRGVAGVSAPCEGSDAAFVFE
ncbi:MAG TPA: hypothetical protein PLP59_12840 [Thermotogota bacterium]|nr:hypothetical protein [Thermotogota bacterium]